MKARLIWGFFLLGGWAFLSSCGKDPVPNAGVSFDVEAEAINESDGKLTSFNPQLQAGGVGQDVQVKILFDKPLTGKTVLNYTVTGTANKKNVTTGTGSSASTSYNDFNLNGGNAKDTETLIVEAGATDATITLTVYEDFDFEDSDDDGAGNYVETVILTLTEVVSGPAQLGETKLTNTLSIKEDDAVFLLQWLALDSSDPTKAGDVDLDLVIQTGGQVANASDNTGTSYEGLFLPAGFPAGTYNFNYPYYSGTSDNVKFTAYMFSNSSGTLNGKSYPWSSTTAPQLTFTGTYKKVNINPYTTYASLATVQTMVKSGINYTNISTITVPSTGSRTTESSFSNGLKPTVDLKLRNDQIQKMMKNKNL